MQKAKDGQQSNEIYPVFQGLNEMGIGDAAIADVAAATHAQMAEWRQGKLRVPGHVMSCLTEFLNGLVQGRRAELSYAAPMGLDNVTDDLSSLRRANDNLAQQRAFNRAFAKQELERGERLFKDWRRRRLLSSREAPAIHRAAHAG